MQLLLWESGKVNNMKSRFCTVILVFCVSVLSIASDTFAQAIPVLTDPIKVRELELMSNQVDMTMSQQEAVIDVYDRYLEDFCSGSFW